MTDADVGKPLLASRMPYPHDFAPQPIDWRKVAQELYRASNMSHGLPMRDEVVVRTISHIIAAAIEDGLS